MFTITRITAAVAVIAVAIAAGTSLAGPPAKGEKVTLTLETPSGPARPASNLADAFAARVKTLSNGTMTVKVVYGESPSSNTTWPWLRTHLNNVRTNKVQLATAWGASMELAGIKTVRALYAPFQLTSKKAAAEATGGPTAAKILAGFDGTGLTGLALAPQGLSRIYAAKKTLATVADFDGATIRTPYGPTSITVLKALGARPVDRNGGTFTDALAKGTITANEINWEIGSGYLPTSKTAGNLVLYPLTDVLVANTGAFNRLTRAQQRILRQAASDARAAMLIGWKETVAATAFCKAGGTIVHASPAQLSALRNRAAGSIASFKRDPATRAIVADVKRIATPSEPVATCKPSALPEPSAGPSGPATTLPPSGDYRRTLTAEAMRAAGADEDNVRNNGGTHTWMFRGSKVTHAGKNPQHSYSCDGTMSVAGPLVRVSFSCDGGVQYFSWRRVGRDVMLKNFDNNKRPFTGWDTLYDGLWTRAG